MESYSSQLIKFYTNEEAMAHTNNLKFQFFHCFKIFNSLQSYKNHSNSIITTEKHIPTKSKFQSNNSRISTKTQTTPATQTKSINSTKCMIASTTIPTALHKRTHISLKKTMARVESRHRGEKGRALRTHQEQQQRLVNGGWRLGHGRGHGAPGVVDAVVVGEQNPSPWPKWSDDSRGQNENSLRPRCVLIVV